VDRNALLSGHINISPGKKFAAPSTNLERKINDIWKDVLKIEKIGIDDNFFDLGGNSLSLIRVCSALKKTLKRDIPVVMMFMYPTIESFANHLKGEETNFEETGSEEINRTGSKEKGLERLKKRRNLKSVN
jgi:acyl carrier protein